ncbi:hypothetical protein, partial [Klebsiella pneumoniae]|uniref:hypothetical protein n=1 Tax=Klebsiella pneumoniae TaxID=573 RepID=UPI001AEE6442
LHPDELGVLSTATTMGLREVLQEDDSSDAGSLKPDPSHPRAEARDESSSLSRSDALTAYLRAMPRRPPLDRSAEAACAERIERGEWEATRAALRTPFALQELLALGGGLLRSETEVRALVREGDVADPHFDEGAAQ